MAADKSERVQFFVECGYEGQCFKIEPEAEVPDLSGQATLSFVWMTGPIFLFQRCKAVDAR